MDLLQWKTLVLILLLVIQTFDTLISRALQLLCPLRMLQNRLTFFKLILKDQEIAYLWYTSVVRNVNRYPKWAKLCIKLPKLTHKKQEKEKNTFMVESGFALGKMNKW